MRRFEEKIKKFVQKNGQNGFALKCDIKKYFPSIPHKKLKEIICCHIKDKEIKSLIEEVIDSYHTNIEYLRKHGISPYEDFLRDRTKTGRGIPIGNQTSQIFGMFYLDSLDRLIKEKLRIKIHTRYMDDFLLVHEDKNVLVNALKEIKKKVGNLDSHLTQKRRYFR